MEIEKKSPASELEKTAGNLLKRQIKTFLIDYFGYLTLALAFIVFAAGLFLFVYPQYQRLTEDDKTVKESLQTGYKDKGGYLSAISGLKKSYQLISAADRKKIEDMVPASSEVVGLIPKIESIVLKNGAVLNSIRVEEGPAGRPKLKEEAVSGEKQESPAGISDQLPEGVGLAKIEISLSSVNYPVLKNLLKTFENNLRLMDLADVNFDVKGNKAVFKIYSYYLSR